MSLLTMLRKKNPNRLFKENRAPVPRVSAGFQVEVSAVADIFSLGSTDPDGDPVTLGWVLTSKPGGSTATLTTVASDHVRISDTSVAGNYVVTLTATDDGGAGRGLSGSALSASVSTTIVVVTPSAPATFNAYNTLGVYRSAQTEASIAAYEASTGINRTLPGYITTFAGNISTWSALNGSVSALCTNFKNRVVTLGHSKLCISLVPFPDKAAAGAFTMSAAAAGSYNTQWAAIAQIIKDAGYSNTEVVIRLGWEFNGNYFLWSILGTKDATATPASFKSMWQNCVTSMRAVMPGLKFDWCVKGGGDSTQAQVDAAYPGASYLNFVGVDAYDYYNGYAGGRNTTTQNAAFDGYVSEKCGLQWAKDLATRDGLLCSFPEWGALHETRSAYTAYGGDDNPIFISRMCRWLDDLGVADLLGYHSYFEHDHTTSDSLDHTLHTIGGTAPAFAFTTAAAQFNTLLKA